MRQPSKVFIAIAVLTILVFSQPIKAQTIPAVSAKALDGSDVALPKSGGMQALILVVGFSKKSEDVCKLWQKKIAAEYQADSRVAFYELPVLQDAPSFVRPMILRGMRKDIPVAEQGHMVPIYEHEEDWKKLVGFSGAGDAYVVVADAQGHVRWQTHGAMSDASYEQLKAAVAKLLEGSAASRN